MVPPDLAKSALRQIYRPLCRAISAKNKQAAAEKAAEILCRQPIFKASQHIACYLSLQEEFNTQALIEKIWQAKKICYLPYIDKGNKNVAEKNIAIKKENKQIESIQQELPENMQQNSLKNSRQKLPGKIQQDSLKNTTKTEAIEKILHFAPYERNEPLHKNIHHVLEPSPTDNTILAKDLDIVILPLVAFDLQGNRLGKGGGYYDCTFSFLSKNQLSTLGKRQKNKSSIPHKPILIGLGFQIQEAKSIPTDPWDIKLDAILTETMIKFIS